MRALIVLVVLLAGCRSPFGCDEKTRVVEVEYSGPFTKSQQAILDRYRDQGWECASDGAIRDAFGRTIGTRYACTICD